MAGSGVLLILATVFIFNQDEVVNSSSPSGFNTGYSFDTKGFKVVTGIDGTMALLGSIPLFIASSKNKRKAMNISFNIQRSPQLLQSSLACQNIPAVSIKIGL